MSSLLSSPTWTCRHYSLFTRGHVVMALENSCASRHYSHLPRGHVFIALAILVSMSSLLFSHSWTSRHSYSSLLYAYNLRPYVGNIFRWELFIHDVYKGLTDEAKRNIIFTKRIHIHFYFICTEQTTLHFSSTW